MHGLPVSVEIKTIAMRDCSSESLECLEKGTRVPSTPTSEWPATGAPASTGTPLGS